MSEPTPERVATAAVGEAELARAIASSGLHVGRGEADTHGATKAEIEALRWLTRRFGEGTFWSSSLERLYEQRWHDRGWQLHVTQRRRGAWRRTSGAVLARMRRKGLVEPAFAFEDTRRYRITDAGREAIA